jgi:nucleoside-diphosphate-sugar epimerase
VSSNLKPRVLVTGAAGLLGSAICDLLAEKDLPFQTLDLNSISHPAALEHFVGLATDQELVQAAVQDVSAVIHLAAIRNPNYGSSVAVFSNALATFTVLDAASAVGVKRAVIASSFSATGLPFSNTQVSLDQLPIDESFANQISDPYALSKNIDELSATYLNTRYGMQTIALRYPYIGDHLDLLPKRFAQVAADPAVGAKELWTYIDIRDAAAITLDCILNETAIPGSYFVTAPNLLGPHPAADLVAQHLVGAKLAAGHGKFDSLVNYSKAKSALNYAPKHSFPNE